MANSILLTLEALRQKEERPTINTKDEYKKRELVITGSSNTHIYNRITSTKLANVMCTTYEAGNE